MADWKKLNEEFDKVLNNMTPEAWKIWSENREIKKAIRRKEMELKTKLLWKS